MAFVPVFSFVLLLLLGSADSWAECTRLESYFYRSSDNVLDGTCSGGSITAPAHACYNGDAVIYNYSCRNNGAPYMSGFRFVRCQSYGDYGYYNYYRCGSKCEADSLDCAQSGGIWRPDRCECLDVMDTVYNCINWSTGNIYTSGSDLAIIQACVGGECKRTTTLNGSCQDWGFCPDGVQSCEISKDSLGRKPCRRSGAETTSGNVCYYQCANGRNLRCKPSSTQYVAGAIYVGTCPERPPVSCDPPPPSSSSLSPLSSSSVGGGSSSSGVGGFSSSCIGDACNDDPLSSSSPFPPPSSSGASVDYMPILEAIRDTLHHANEQRKVLDDYAVEALPAIEGVEDNTYNNWRETYKIRNELTKFSERSLPMSEHLNKSVDSATTLLTDIRDYLRHDTTMQDGHDTSYNPLLRDIKDAIESQTDSIVGARDSLSKPSLKDWFDKYYGDSAQSNGYVGKKLAEITANLPDSAKRAVCARFNACLSGPDPKSCVLMPESRGCMDGGTPFDTGWNLDWGILKTLWDFFFDSEKDTVPLPSVAPLDTTPLARTPAEDSARKIVKDANDSIDLPSIRRTLDSMRARLDSVKTKKDSVKIDVDSTMMDSVEAARYVQHILLPSGTGSDCFVCHADLGTFGGLVPEGLSIHIDFSDFGGYNWCDLGRAIIRIMTLVVCVSLTLGSWAAAFGYSPKNDA